MDPSQMVSLSALLRERAARHEAERLLEEKARELWERSEQLRNLSETLDEQVKVRTRELEIANEAANAASRVKTEFLANMSHEIRTPMTAILGYADLLLDEADKSPTPSPQHEYIATIRRNGEHLLGIINDILDISKIEAGRMTVEHIPTDPDRILIEVESLMRVRAVEKGIELIVLRQTPLPSAIHSDPLRLRQILLNLIGNAIKFTDQGRVTLHARHQTHPHPALIFEVQDTGIGISADQLERLFTPFSQADSSTTRRYGGSGLGLSISQSLARMLDGEIVAQSTPGRGSTFVFRLSAGIVNRIAESPNDTQCPTVPHAAGNPRPIHGARIFFAEDGPDNQHLVSHVLRKAGAIVTLFDNGRLCFDALIDRSSGKELLAQPIPCDLIISDMQMPEMDGYSLARNLRRVGWTRPIIALTAHAMAGDAEKCFAAGCDEYATKPIDRAGLVAMCERRLRNPTPGIAPNPPSE